MQRSVLHGHEQPPLLASAELRTGRVFPRDVGVALLVGVAIAGGIGVLAKPDLLHVYLGGGIV